MVSAGSIIALFVAIASATAINVNSISQCPPLTARASPAKDVTDLRIDDIKIVAGLGDSIMAGFAMMGVDYDTGGSGLLNLSAISEYRGHSYAIGGDSNAVTIANFVKQYSPDVKGASVLTHLASFCHGTTCGFPQTIYRPLRDNLNGAQSGAVAMNLQFELDYLIPRMKQFFISTSYKNDWKMITIQIGSNDQCASCNSTIQDQVTADAYGKYVEAAIQRIKTEIPKVVVNLLGSFKVSGVFPLSAGNSYCKPNGFLFNTEECSCSSSPENLAKMDALADSYNVKLQQIADKYKGQAGGTFAVMYSPAPIDLSSFPIDALSNVDCFHPSIKGHQWVAKTIWNQMFTPISLKPNVLKFDANLQISCAENDHRLPTT